MTDNVQKIGWRNPNGGIDIATFCYEKRENKVRKNTPSGFENGHFTVSDLVVENAF